jgi:hypothetical protein
MNLTFCKVDKLNHQQLKDERKITLLKDVLDNPLDIVTGRCIFIDLYRSKRLLFTPNLYGVSDKK